MAPWSAAAFKLHHWCSFPVIKLNKIQYLWKFQVIWSSFASHPMCKKLTQNSIFFFKNVLWRSATPLKTPQSFLFLGMVRIALGGSFPENLKSFESYPQRLQGQKCQKGQRFIKNHVFFGAPASTKITQWLP